MGVLVVIPARFASARYLRKPLVDLRGATGEAKSLIHRSWDAVMAVTGVDRVVIATDDDRIKDAAEACGADVINLVVGHLYRPSSRLHRLTCCLGSLKRHCVTGSEAMSATAALRLFAIPSRAHTPRFAIKSCLQVRVAMSAFAKCCPNSSS